MGRLKQHLKEVVNVSWNFAGRLDTNEKHQMNAVVGLAAEAGEVLDIGKKMWFHEEKAWKHYREKLVLELGDVMFYFLKCLDVFGITMEEIIAGNREKLESRHPELGKVTERFGAGAIK